MFNLMKYELIKQKNSKIVFGAIMLILEIIFLIGVIINKEDMYAISIALMSMTVTITLFWVAFEAIFTYANDLKNKSGYMLFMTPNSNQKILGSKILVSVITMFVAGVIFLLLAFADVTFMLARFSQLNELWILIKSFLEGVNSVDITWSLVIIAAAAMLLSWINLLVTGFLAVTISHTVLANIKMNGLISFVLFLVINFISSFIMNAITDGINRVNGLHVINNIQVAVMFIWTLIITAVCFAASAELLKRKLAL